MSGEKRESPWNSLEVTKLIVSALLPISLVVFGYMINKSLQDRQHETRLAESVIEKRKEIYEDIRVPLNNIYVYIREVGGYKNFTPDTITRDRRTLHQVMHTQRAYWSPRTFSAYLRYMDDIAFVPYSGGLNEDALINDNVGQKAYLPGWQAAWAERFSGNEHPDHHQAYEALIDLLAEDIGANVGR